MKVKNSPKDILYLKIDAEFPLIQYVTYEWRRLYGFLTNYLDNHLDYALYWWVAAKGMKKYDREDDALKLDKPEFKDPVSVLNWYMDHAKGNTILVIEDLHLYLDESYSQRAVLLSQLREIAKFSDKKQCLIMIQPVQLVPIELSKDIFIYELPLPGIKLLNSVLNGVIDDIKLDDEKYDNLEDLAEAALGLTVEEAKITFKEIIIEYDKINQKNIIDVIQRKEQIIKKSGVLEYFHQSERFNDIGGMDNLKKWLTLRRDGFTKKAQDAGLKPPKGVLLLGIPGGGKSLIAKAVASAWNLPLLKFDLGKVFAGIVGASENNIRKAINLANAVAPSILWIDEIEKGLSGVGSSDQTDGGVTSRIFGTLLTWMQEKTEPVFVVATANDISKLPPELLRKGRFDEIFFVDLPGDETRKEIWEIHIKKRLKEKYDSNLIDFDALVKQTEGFTGAEIEESVNDGLYRAFSNNEDLSSSHLIDAVNETYPLSKVMGDSLLKLRNWAKYRARFASDDQSSIPKHDEKVPRIKGEKIAIFEE